MVGGIVFYKHSFEFFLGGVYFNSLLEHILWVLKKSVSVISCIYKEGVTTHMKLIYCFEPRNGNTIITLSTATDRPEQTVLVQVRYSRMTSFRY